MQTSKINNLRKIAQKGKENRGWVYYYSTRFFSIYISSFLFRLGIHPDLISLAAIVFMWLCFASFLILPSTVWLGLLLMYLSLLFDKVDGEVARLRKMTSSRGIAFDRFLHFFLPIFFYFGFGLNRIIYSDNTFLGLALIAYGGSQLWLRYLKEVVRGLRLQVPKKLKLKNFAPWIIPWLKLNDTIMHPIAATLFFYINFNLLRIFLFLSLFVSLLKSAIMSVRLFAIFEVKDRSKLQDWKS